MPKTLYVVKLSESIDLYLTYYSTDPAHCLWGNPNDALVWSTLAEAQAIAADIGGGTVGTTKP